MAEAKQIPVEKIKVGNHALRLEAEDEGIDSLAASIRRIGILVPLVVRREGDEYHIIAGHRRYVAAVRIGLEKIPCIVYDSSEAQSSEMAFAENLFREDLTAVEIAAGIKDALEKKIMDVPALAKAMHRSEHWINAQLQLLSWPVDVLDAIHFNWLSVAAASNLVLVTDDTYRDFLLRNARDSGATARTTSAWLQAFRAMQPPEQAVQEPPADGPDQTIPMVPQAPCLACSQVYRTDELSHVPMCAPCIQAIRDASLSR